MPVADELPLGRERPGKQKREKKEERRQHGKQHEKGASFLSLGVYESAT